MQRSPKRSEFLMKKNRCPSYFRTEKTLNSAMLRMKISTTSSLNVHRAFNLATQELVDPSNLENCADSISRTAAQEMRNLWRDRSLLASAYGRYLGLLLAEDLLDFDLLQRIALDLMENNPKVLDDIKKSPMDIG